MCARSYTDETFTGSSTPVAPALVLSASTTGRVFHSSASRDPGASASVRAHRVSVSRDCDANASEEHIALATAMFGAPAPVDGHIDIDIRKDLYANVVLHHSVRVIGERMTGNSLHRLPCRLENDGVASAGSYGMLGVPGLSCQAPKQNAGGQASLYCRGVTDPHLAACDKNTARFHHHLIPVGIGRVALSLRLWLRKREPKRDKHRVRIGRTSGLNLGSFSRISKRVSEQRWHQESARHKSLEAKFC